MKGEQITMALLKNKSKNQPTMPNESYWNKVKEKAHFLIADILNQNLPLPNLREKKNFNPEEDADYRISLVDYQEEYRDNLPTDSEQIAHEIAYGYLLLVIKSLIGTLKTFTCHDPAYMEGLTE